MLKIYLAGRYSRREELVGYAYDIEALGHEITSRWLNGSHLATEDDLVGDDQTLAIRLASEDWDDLETSDLVIAFTEPQRSAPNRGGRHVELGLALALHKTIWLVGPRENVFHALCDRLFPRWGECLQAIKAVTPRKEGTMRFGPDPEPKPDDGGGEPPSEPSE